MIPARRSYSAQQLAAPATNSTTTANSSWFESLVSRSKSWSITEFGEFGCCGRDGSSGLVMSHPQACWLGGARSREFDSASAPLLLVVSILLPPPPLLVSPPHPPRSSLTHARQSLLTSLSSPTTTEILFLPRIISLFFNQLPQQPHFALNSIMFGDDTL